MDDEKDELFSYEALSKIFEIDDDGQLVHTDNEKMLDWWFSIDRFAIHGIERDGNDSAKLHKKLLKLTSEGGGASNYMSDYIDHNRASDLIQEFEESTDLDIFGAIENYFKLIPPVVSNRAKIPKKARSMYRESRICFIFEQYNAAIALSRAIVEVVLKEIMNVPDLHALNLGKIVDEAILDKRINKEAGRRARMVIASANNILHRSEQLATKKDAGDIIEHSMVFLEETYLVEKQP